MRNDNHPLVKALNFKKAKKGPEHEIFPLSPRSFEVKHSDGLGFSEMKVGSGVSVKLKGIVASQHPDGHMVLHVSEVRPDNGQEIHNETKETPVLNVRTQQTYAG